MIAKSTQIDSIRVGFKQCIGDWGSCHYSRLSDRPKKHNWNAFRTVQKRIICVVCSKKAILFCPAYRIQKTYVRFPTLSSVS